MMSRGWKDRERRAGGKKCSLPRHPGPSYTRPHATLCSQAMPFELPPGQTKTPFRPVPTVIMQSRSNLFPLAALCEVTQPRLCHSFAGLCIAQPVRLILLFWIFCLALSILKKDAEMEIPPAVSQCGFWFVRQRLIVCGHNLMSHHHTVIQVRNKQTVKPHELPIYVKPITLIVHNYIG